jgi:hypothetical protein
MQNEPEDQVNMRWKRMKDGRVVFVFTRPVKSFVLEHRDARALNMIVNAPLHALLADLETRIEARIGALETRLDAEVAYLDRERSWFADNEDPLGPMG